LFNYEDALHVLGLSVEKPIASDIFSLNTTSHSIMSQEDAAKMFPELANSSNANVWYAPVVMAHSLPSKNQRMRCFTAKTLKRSANTVRDNLVNIEHELIENDIGSTNDAVCGHIKSVFVKDQCLGGDAVALYALSVLYSRHRKANRIAKEFANGVPWRVSMECGHNVLESAFLYEGDFIPFKDAPSGMLQCIKSDTVIPYLGKELAFVLGGEDGMVNFWGLALTKCPADKDANVLGMFTAAPKEIASTKGFFPIHANFFGVDRKIENFSEIATDNLLKESGSISVICVTSESDGHYHKVLSNGVVVPENGHSHLISTFIIKPGSKPTFTAVLTEHADRISAEHNGYSSDYRYHSHLIDVDLKTEYKEKKGILSEMSSAQELEGDMSKVVDALAKAVSDLKEIGSVLKAGNQSSTSQDDQRIATAVKAVDAIVNLNIDKAIASAAEEEIAQKVSAGEFVSKKDHEDKVKQAVDTALATERETIKIEQERVNRLNARLDAAKSIGIDLSFEPKEGITIESIIKGIPLDDAGEEVFQNNLAVWTALAKSAKPVQSEAASMGAKTPKTILTVGSGKTSKEVAGSGNAATESGKQKFGKHALTVV